jgi:hypothetical protein
MGDARRPGQRDRQHRGALVIGLWWLSLVPLGAFLVAAPAAWASDGQVPVVVAGFMYAVEVLVAFAALRQYSKRRSAASLEKS